MARLPFLLLFLSPVVVTLAATLRGPAVLLPVGVMFGLIPALDALFGVNRAERSGAPDPVLRWLPIAFVPVHLATLAYGLHVVVTGDLLLLERAGLVVALGLGTAIAINVAHELMHRPGRPERGLAALVMATATYTHFCVEHVHGHHRNLGTHRDPATARRGESLYQFLPRTLAGGLRSAWTIETARVGVGWSNRLVRYGVAQLVLFIGIGATLGVPGLLAFLGQSAVAVLMLETINYVEHYGLVRTIAPTGTPERVQPRHSWNSGHAVSNWMLLNLARHSDHHANAGRAFPDLRTIDDAPQLPAGYSAMMLLATVPPVWFRVMEPRVEAARMPLPHPPGAT